MTSVSMASKKVTARAAVAALKTRHDQVVARLTQGLPQVFGLPVDEVLDFSIDHASGTQSGILVSQGVPYRWELGNGVKRLERMDGSGDP